MYLIRLKSVLAQSGWFSSSASAAGTMKNRVTPRFSTASNTRGGSNSLSTTPGRPAASAITPSPVPPMWAQGMATSTASSSSHRVCTGGLSMLALRSPNKLRLDSTAPLGWPVVPEV